MSWVASESIHFPEVFTLVKPRINIADVGNGLVKQRSVDTYTYDASPWGAANTVSLTSSLVDPNIKAQHSITKEAGLDLWLFKGRVKFDGTYFIKNAKRSDW